MTKTTMYRKTRCTNCEYEQETFVSYYLDNKQWNKGHDLVKCNEIRKNKKVFTEIFPGTLDALANLSIVK